jgi:hypothetical protein
MIRYTEIKSDFAERETDAMKNRKLGIGACLCAIGALGIVLGPALGLTDLGRPWSFLAGFTIGVIAGLGVALSIAGLVGMRRPPVSEL